MYMYICIYMCIYVCVCTYIFIHTHTHTHTQPYIGPTQVQSPFSADVQEADVGCGPPPGGYTGYSGCYDGYTGGSFGKAAYRPLTNQGYFRVSIVITAFSERSLNWAQNNLRGNEDTLLDTTGAARRCLLPL
jgi:hypothetical protein